MSFDQLRRNRMMSHLLDALEKGTDIGHYGRLVFTMVARHFLADEEIVSRLSGNGGLGEREARALLLQVREHGYNPPRREKILEWQKEQDFPICPDAGDPGACNPYRDLEFPGDIYANISEYYEKRADQ